MEKRNNGNINLCKNKDFSAKNLMHYNCSSSPIPGRSERVRKQKLTIRQHPFTFTTALVICCMIVRHGSAEKPVADHYLRSLRGPTVGSTNHYFRSLRSGTNDATNHYWRTSTSNTGGTTDHYLRSLRPFPGTTNHYLRSLRTAGENDGGYNSRSLRSGTDMNHYFRSLRAQPASTNHYFRSLRSTPGGSVNHYWRSVRAPIVRDHYLRSLRSFNGRGGNDHYFRSLRSPAPVNDVLGFLRVVRYNPAEQGDEKGEALILPNEVEVKQVRNGFQKNHLFRSRRSDEDGESDNEKEIEDVSDHTDEESVN